MKSIIEPTTCISIHHHYCWGFVHNVKKRHHVVDPNVAVVHHYKKCHWKQPDKCREEMKHTTSDDTVLKYRTELIRTVSQTLRSIYK